jgi:hypothetical protein
MTNDNCPTCPEPNCNALMHWRPIANMWVCFECRQAPEMNPWNKHLTTKTLWIMM